MAEKRERIRFTVDEVINYVVFPESDSELSGMSD